ncbi:universal stress protein, partial [Enterococcus faecium]|nr:universal stress protein [Enterococcus faecium]
IRHSPCDVLIVSDEEEQPSN